VSPRRASWKLWAHESGNGGSIRFSGNRCVVPRRLRLPAVTRARLWPFIIVGYLLFDTLYLGSAAVEIRTPRMLGPTAIDRAVPFVAASIWVYLSQFLLLPWTLATVRDDVTRSRTFYAMLLATLISLPVFVLFPTCVAHPPPPTGGLTGFAWQTLYFGDTPNNAFPSLHVALAAIAGVALWQSRRYLIAVVWPGGIMISTLTTRQHISWDVAGGLLVAVLAWILTPRLVAYERTRLPDDTASH
jgi:membrane-associated phospholipid phosphatase